MALDLTTYSGLKAAIADYLGRDDLTDQIPVFIRLAERRINREMRLRCMEKWHTVDVEAGQGTVTLPDGFLEMRDVTWGNGGMARHLEYRPMDGFNGAVAGCSGMPREYTISGYELGMIPVPDSAGTIHFGYYGEIPALSEEDDTNDLLSIAPDLYLYGALVESGPFTRSSAPLEIWAEYYSAARQKLDASEQRARFTSNLRMRPARRI